MGEHFDKKVSPGEICPGDLNRIREAVCVQTEKVYDSCKEKDCIEDAQVLFFSNEVRHLVNISVNVKFRRADVAYVYVDVEPVPFKRGFYTLDIKYFIVVTLDLFTPLGIRTVRGLVLFDKKVVLFGSEGGVKIFKAHYIENGIDTPERSILQQDNLPISKVEVADPIALTARIVEEHHCGHDSIHVENLPRIVAKELETSDGELGMGEDRGHGHDNDPERNVLVSFGLFSIIKLVRYTQLLIPVFDFCIPDKNCIAATEDNPCDLFETIDFPVDEFFPPQKMDFPGAEE